MTRSRVRSAAWLTICSLASACGAPPPVGFVDPAPVSGAATANERLDTVAEGCYDAQLALDPLQASSIGDDRFNHLYLAWFSGEVRARSAVLTRDCLARLTVIDHSALDEQRRLTYDVMRRLLAISEEGARFPSHLQPLNPFDNFATAFALLGSGAGVHPFRSAKDYDDFLGRVIGFEGAVDIAIVNMRQGAARGLVQPRILMERVLPQLATHIVEDVEHSVFHQPIRSLPADFTAADRDRLTSAYATAIRARIVPAYRRLYDFVRDEYLPSARTTVGLATLPDGRAWYDHLVRLNTTSDLSAEEIHEIGIAEVARIQREIETVKAEVGFSGSLAEFHLHVRAEPDLHFTTSEGMISEYRAAKARIDARMDRLFDLRPVADYEIRAIEPFRERGASAGSYVPASPEGSRPGVFYLNTHDPPKRQRYLMESLLLHEGSPGHHLQISIQREARHLPRIRRFSAPTAFVEGWALYAESLGDELGLYGDPHQRYGALVAELWRAIRLVLDTGIHALGWTREEAIDYARRNSPLPEPALASEVDRFIAVPGQALAYKIGQLRITELRHRAERDLGPRFDIREFHREILQDGALPLDLLEAKIDGWIDGKDRDEQVRAASVGWQ